MEEAVYKRTLDFLGEHPEYAEILRRAVEAEEEKKSERYYLGWTWYQVRSHVSRIQKLILEGIAKVSYDSRSNTNYLLVDREAVKKALDDFAKLEEQPMVEEEVSVPKDLFDIIVGYEDVKWAIRKSLSSDKPVHFLFIGPPSTAKTMFLMELDRLPRSRYVTGSAASKAGITRFLLDFRPRYLLIDEIDKMSREDYSALLSVMETGKVSELKYKRTEEAELKLWVFAHANSLRGIPRELLSRFQKFHFREYSVEDFKKVVVNVLTKREGRSREISRYVAERLSRLTRDPRDAVRVSRLAKNKREVDRAIEIMLKYKSFH